MRINFNLPEDFVQQLVCAIQIKAMNGEIPDSP